MDADDEAVCYVCWEDDDETAHGVLRPSPCACKTLWMHRECQRRLLREQVAAHHWLSSDDACLPFRCKVCRAVYRNVTVTARSRVPHGLVGALLLTCPMLIIVTLWQLIHAVFGSPFTPAEFCLLCATSLVTYYGVVRAIETVTRLPMWYEAFPEQRLWL